MRSKNSASATRLAVLAGESYGYRKSKDALSAPQGTQSLLIPVERGNLRTNSGQSSGNTKSLLVAGTPWFRGNEFTVEAPGTRLASIPSRQFQVARVPSALSVPR